jgi:hypothetical protein
VAVVALGEPRSLTSISREANYSTDILLGYRWRGYFDLLRQSGATRRIFGDGCGIGCRDDEGGCFCSILRPIGCAAHGSTGLPGILLEFRQESQSTPSHGRKSQGWFREHSFAPRGRIRRKS